ncbi:MAG: DUF4129 domain-containing protein [Bacteroidia bacterium]|nr:DUF4129 domain-containing protein [Bacteroidia bacterium]
MTLKQFRYIFFLWLAWLCAMPSAAAALADSSVSEVRRFDREQFFDIQDSREFRYPENREKVETLMDKIREWLRGIFGELDFMRNADTDWMKGFGYFVIFLIIVLFVALVVWLMLRSDFRSLFTRRGARVKKPEYEILEEDIHNIEYIDEIQKAVSEGNYRKAIRLQYLRSLKLLSDHHVIYWTIERTNSDFRNMMRGRSDYQAFDYLATAYEFVWYGYRQLNEEEYRELAKDFETFNQAYREVTA